MSGQGDVEAYRARQEANTMRNEVERLRGIHARIAEDAKLPSVVWCRTCRRSQRVDPAKCLASGWPKCCGYTMTIDHPSTWPTPVPPPDGPPPSEGEAADR